MSIDPSHYQDYVNYKNFLTQVEEKTNNNNSLQAIKDKIKDINGICVNKSFIFIIIFERWINDNHVTLFKEAGSPPAYNKNGQENSFLKTDFYPFRKNSDIIPLIDISPIIEIINSADSTYLSNYDDSLGRMYKEIAEALPKNNTVTKVKRIYEYCNKNFSNFEKADGGLFIEMLSVFEKEKKEFIVKENDYLRNKEKFTGESIIENLIDDIKTLKAKESANLIDIMNTKEFIKKISKQIISFLNQVLKYTYDLKNVLRKENDETEIKESISIKSLTVSEQERISIDEIINLAEPTIKPAFKKAYIVRENNLTAYIKLKLTRFLDNDDYFEINNFNIPYNNITNFSHDISKNESVLTIIDTDGNVSDLLINNMYSYFSRNPSTRDNVDLSKPLILQIEYGWSGPKTDDEEELLDEKVFVKKTFRGYIKSYSSQFKREGTEHTLTIVNNDDSQINFGNYYELFYANIVNNKLDKYLSLSLSFIVLYFIFKYSDDNLSERIENIFSISFFRQEDFLIEKIFNMINFNATTPLKIVEVDPQNYQIISSIVGSEDNKLIFTNLIRKKITIDTETVDNSDFILITKLIKDIKPKIVNTKKEYLVYDITSKELKSILADLNGSYSMNGWIFSSYLLWRIRRFFIDNGELYLFHDTTGLFDYLFDENKIDKTKFYYILNKFNLFGRNSEDIREDTQLLKVLKESIVNIKFNQFNQFELTKLLDPEIKLSGNKSLNFFANKLELIFNSIKNIGHKKNFDSHNIYQISDKIKSDFMIYHKIDNDYLNEIIKDYKKKIYANKESIYSSLDDSSSEEEEKREFISFSYFLANFNRRISLQLLNEQETVKLPRLEYQLPPRNNLVDIGKTNTAIAKYDKEFKAALDVLKKENFSSKIKKDFIKNKKLNILYLQYELSMPKIFNSKGLSFNKKVGFLGRNIVQSYSSMPRITPKTRNSNKQFFSQGNQNILKEGTGDIIEFSVDDFDGAFFNALMISNKNSKNIGFEKLESQTFIEGLYENAAKYHRTYIDINGQIDVKNVLQDMALLEINYQNQLNLKASITILGEPYWSNINLKNKLIYINISYSNGNKSSHSGIYSVSNTTQNISNNKFTTKLDLEKVPTFLQDFNSLSKNSDTTIIIKEDAEEK